MFTIKQLAQDHPYRTSESNFYSNDASERFESFDEFIAEWGDVDIDYNLCFRFDLTKEEKRKDKTDVLYSAQFAIIQQRKGIYYPITVTGITESDAPRIAEWLAPHFEYMQKIWLPFTSKTNII